MTRLARTYRLVLLLALLLGWLGDFAQEPNQQLNNQEEVWSDDEWDKLQKRIDFGEPKIEEPKEEKQENDQDISEGVPEDANTSTWLNGEAGKVIAYVFIAILVIGLVILLYKSQLGSGDTKVVYSETVTGEEEELDVVETDFDRLLRLALEKGDYRLAIRMLFLNALKRLHESRQIIWQKHKTNHHYVDEMRSHSEVIRFRQLVLLFEIVWYGDKTTSVRDYEAVKSLFDQFQQSMYGQ